MSDLSSASKSRREGFLRRFARRLQVPISEVDDERVRKLCTDHGGTLLENIQGRSRVTVVGTLRSVAIQPHGHAPSLEAQLCDGTGYVTIIWMGHREVAGVHAGRRIKATGMVSIYDGRAVMYNPWYELLPEDAMQRKKSA